MSLTDELLKADLRVYRGGNKARLIGRIYVAIWNAPGDNDHMDTYEEFRDRHIKWTFDKLHQVYDHMLPQQFRSKVPGIGGAAPRQAKQSNGLTEAQQAKFDRFCKAPARLEKRFNKSAEYFLSCGNTDHLLATARRYQEAAHYCANLIDDTAAMAMLWNLGMRTGGDLESQVERTMRI